MIHTAWMEGKRHLPLVRAAWIEGGKHVPMIHTTRMEGERHLLRFISSEWKVRNLYLRRCTARITNWGCAHSKQRRMNHEPKICTSCNFCTNRMIDSFKSWSWHGSRFLPSESWITCVDLLGWVERPPLNQDWDRRDSVCVGSLVFMSQLCLWGTKCESGNKVRR